MGEITVAVLTKDDAPALVEQLKRNFCLHEPILNHLNVAVSPSFLQACVDFIDQGLTLKAIDENGKIAGVFVAELKQRSVSGN